MRAPIDAEERMKYYIHKKKIFDEIKKKKKNIEGSTTKAMTDPAAFECLKRISYLLRFL